MADVKTLEFWEKKLQNSTQSILPTDYVRPSPVKVIEAKAQVLIPKEINDILDSLSTELNITKSIITLCVLNILIYRITGDEDIVIGVNSYEGKPYVLRNEISGNIKFKTLLKTIENKSIEGKKNFILFSDLYEYINRNKNSKDNNLISLFKISFIHSDKISEKNLLLPSKGITTDLTIFYQEDSSGGDSYINLHYNSMLFKKERMLFFIDQLFNIILGVGSTNNNSNTISNGINVEIGKISLLNDKQRSILPDPTIDLHWSDFKGSIQDIFTQNARKFPTRECIIETENIFLNDSKKRIFNYAQINAASNLVAYKLINSGIVQGDVVMIYAYRGVDLVVAVMGVLKAGATFSVIDPAYPPSRQIIYLSVARPSALIMLKKAGIISPTVRKYISDELNLKTEIPALQILDNGELLGGSFTDGLDVLSDYKNKAEVDPNVLVGPDSNPTLSFTSGSEGIPKGVLGRHFSLTYYFPWMANRFSLSEKDNFTMLSGIAHDPIQRDIFTPLFLGAKLLVPTQDDIGTPGRLAEWMAENGATITHLTPAMGQLLSAQATASIPSLKHAFFVGDILTKRDCMRLQTLARNVSIVNMYGTTETQRSVSYYEIPSVSDDPSFIQSQKDIMPAGQGMKDVQLLVINRNDRTQTCGIGEIGEIYVRAGGLAEGYLRLPDLTREKFVKNWFVPEDKWEKLYIDGSEPWRKFYKKPRDRMYRTGDLGRYLPDGNVECSGRADDQVKIRGFRIELGEIDTHLSQHPLVRENITLLKRDKNEEPTLISYFVPQSHSSSINDFLSAEENNEDEDDKEDPIVQGLIKYRRLIKNIREYLKKKLPSYSVPSVIVPLTKMPLNPNGKVDKPALPFPDTAQLSVVAKKVENTEHSNFTPLEAEIRDIWLDILPHRPVSVSPDDSFFDLGGHSILATQMIFQVRRRYLIDVPLNLIFKSPTISSFAAEIDRIKSGDDVVATDANEMKHTEVKESEKKSAFSYYDDAVKLEQTLPERFSAPKELPYKLSENLTILLTGATGFLGSFLILDLLEKRKGNFKLIVHVRAPSPAQGFERIKTTAQAYGIWKENWAKRIEIVVGDLAEPRLGISEDKWNELAKEVDIIIHNGALVHWVYPYSNLRAANVLSTVELIKFASFGKAKTFTFVSSTSSIDTDYYVNLSDKLIESGKQGILESDDLMGSKEGLGNGYGQSKWVSEYLLRRAGKRGLRGSIVRPGYVVGDSKSGTTNVDDFLVRMLKGCVQLGLTPDIYNTVNMVPVDHVARIVVASTLSPPSSSEYLVVHVTGHPRIRFNEFLGMLSQFGYNTKETEYIPWRVALENYVVKGTGESALYPLLHFVLDNLPMHTKAPELDDSNAKISLKSDEKWTGEDVSSGVGIDFKQMGIYLAYLVAIGYLPKPDNKSSKYVLPDLNISDEVLMRLQSVGGRGAKTN